LTVPRCDRVGPVRAGERAAELKRTAMLTEVMRHLEVKAIDDALDLVPGSGCYPAAEHREAEDGKERLPVLKKAFRTRGRATKVLVEEQEADLGVAVPWTRSGARAW
jgi:hypothetical protein